MGEEVKRIDIKEFREKGYLQEANRLFFHPLGLALEIVIDDNDNYSLGGVWDYRNDPEGMFFGDSMITESKVQHVKELRESKIEYRKEVVDVLTDVDGIQVKSKDVVLKKK